MFIGMVFFDQGAIGSFDDLRACPGRDFQHVVKAGRRRWRFLPGKMLRVWAGLRGKEVAPLDFRHPVRGGMNNQSTISLQQEPEKDKFLPMYLPFWS